MDGNSPDKKASSLQINRAEHDRRIVGKLRYELGPQICALLDDAKVIEIMLNPDGPLWCEWLGQSMEWVGTMPKAQAESLIGTVTSSLRTHIMVANPILECELPLDDSRFEALLSPIVSGPIFTIRKKAGIVFTLANYVKSGIMTETQCEAIKWAVRERKNILVVGGTGTGKTTLTNAIIAEIDTVTPEHRIVIIEDTRELQCSSPNVVPLRAADHVDMTRLLKATTRLRPDRILISETRDGSALVLLKAWNTGHPGGTATVHASSANAGLIRMEQLMVEATVAPMQALIAEVVDLIIAIEKTTTGRRIKEVVTVSGHDGTNYITQPVQEIENDC